MSFKLVVPKTIFGGWSKDFGKLRLSLLYHSLQADQRWLFLFTWFRKDKLNKYNPIRFGYRTRGDALPKYSTYHEAGWHWPWKYRSTSGRH